MSVVVCAVGLFSVPERNVFYPAEKYKNKSKPLSSKVLKNLNDSSNYLCKLILVLKSFTFTSPVTFIAMMMTLQLKYKDFVCFAKMLHFLQMQTQ